MDPTTDIPVRLRDDGLYEKDTFDPSTAVPVSEISQGEAKWVKPLSDLDKARALNELIELEKGKKQPLYKKIDWALTSDTARDVVTAGENALLTGGASVVVGAVRGAADVKDNAGIFERAWRGILYPGETARFTDKLAVKDEPEWAKLTRSIGEDVFSFIAVGVGANRAKVELFARDTARKIEQASEVYAAENVGVAPKDLSVATAEQASLAKSVDKFKSEFRSAQLSKLQATEVTPEIAQRSGTQTLAELQYEKTNLANLVGKELENISVKPYGLGGGVPIPKVGQVCQFTSEGKVLVGEIKEIVGKRVTIDLGGKSVVAMMNQLSVPEPVKPAEPKPQDFKTVASRLSEEELNTLKEEYIQSTVGVSDSSRSIGVQSRDYGTHPKFTQKGFTNWLNSDEAVKGYDDAEHLALVKKARGNEQGSRPQDFKTAEEYVASKITPEMIKRGHDIMPSTGTTIGDESLPLYRFVSGDTLREGGEYGIHWTHSYKEMQQMASEEAGYIITAKHPGAKSILDWENPSDLKTMEDTIGSYKYRDKVFPEVPVRPNTKMDVLKIEKVGEDGKRTIIKDQLTSEWQAAQGGTTPPPEKPTAVSPGEPNLPKKKGILGNNSGQVNTGLDDAEEFATRSLVPLSTRLEDIDPSLKHAVRKHLYDIGIQNKKDTEAILPFLESTKKISKPDLEALDIALKNADPASIDPIINKYGVQAEYQAIRGVLDDIYKRAKDAGMDVGYLDTYFPRKVEDVEGLLSYFKNSDKWSMIRKAFDAESTKIGRPLTDEEKGDIVSKMVRGFGEDKITFGSAGHTKERTVSQITPDINKFYRPAIPTLLSYINGMNTNIAARNFFGKGTNLDNSIGEYVTRLVDQGIISINNEKELTDVLKAVFNARGTRGIITGFKNFSYIATMGSPISAITQIQDLAFSLYSNGYYNTWMGLKNKELTKQDLGIENIADEFTDPSKSSRLVTKVFKMIGLDAMDAMGKEALINGAWLKLQKKAISNDQKFITMINDVFGAEAPGVIDDFQRGNITDDVKYILFSELSDYQPISIAEMPEYYAKGGNMRIFYMLKSYTIKQIDVFRREVFKKMKKEPKEAFGNLIRLAGALMILGATADTIKDLMLGRKTKLQDVVVDNLLRLMGFSKWQLYKSRQDGMFETVLESILPPIPFVDDMWKDFVSLAEKKKTVSKLRVWQRLPLVGKFYYWWFGGGKDIKNKKKPSKIRG